MKKKFKTESVKEVAVMDVSRYVDRNQVECIALKPISNIIVIRLMRDLNRNNAMPENLDT